MFLLRRFALLLGLELGLAIKEVVHQDLLFLLFGLTPFLLTLLLLFLMLVLQVLEYLWTDYHILEVNTFDVLNIEFVALKLLVEEIGVYILEVRVLLNFFFILK